MSLLASWLASPSPDAAVEIAAERVSAAVVAPRGGGLAVSAHAIEPLAPGTVLPSLTSVNITDRAAVSGAVRRAVERLSTRPARVALVIPDSAAKVSLVRFEKVPQRREDLDQLVRWQVRKSAPFPIEEACVSYSLGQRDASGAAEYIVVLARQDVVREYESVCEEAGLYPGLVDIATLSLLNLFLAGRDVPAGDWLLVHVRPEYTSVAIMRGAEVIFFRNRPEGEEDTLADVVHQTAMYYQDRLAGRGFSHVLLGGAGRTPGAVEAARRNLEERLGVPVEPVDPTTAAALTDRIQVSPELLDALGPLVGVMRRTRAEAARA